MEAIMANPRFHKHARRLSKQLDAMSANQDFQDLGTSITQVLQASMAGPNSQRHVKRILAHAEAIMAHLNSQKPDGGPELDSFSLAEIKWSSSGASLVPSKLPARRLLAAASRPAASRVPQSRVRIHDPRLASMSGRPLVAGIGARLQQARMTADSQPDLSPDGDKPDLSAMTFDERLEYLGSLPQVPDDGGGDDGKSGFLDEESLFGIDIDNPDTQWWRPEFWKLLSEDLRTLNYPSRKQVVSTVVSSQVAFIALLFLVTVFDAVVEGGIRTLIGGEPFRLGGVFRSKAPVVADTSAARSAQAAEEAPATAGTGSSPTAADDALAAGDAPVAEGTPTAYNDAQPRLAEE